GDRRQHDPDAFRGLVEEREVDVAEFCEGGELDHAPDAVLEHERKHDKRSRLRLTEARADPDVVLWDVGQQDSPPIARDLADEALARPDLRWRRVVGFGRIAGKE